MWPGRTFECDRGAFIEIPYLSIYPYPGAIAMNSLTPIPMNSLCIRSKGRLFKSSLPPEKAEHSVLRQVVRSMEKSTDAPDEEDSSDDRIDGFSAALIGLPYKARLELVMSDLAFRASFKDGMEIILIPELTHEDFAAMIGSSRFIVSRLIVEMISAGLVERSAKRYVLSEKWDFEPYIQLITARCGLPDLAVL
jgi:hypothetical protein